MDQERAAESLFGNLAQRVGAVPQGAPVPPAIRRQRWSPDTSASAVPRRAGFGQRIGEDRLGSVEGSVEVLGHPES